MRTAGDGVNPAACWPAALVALLACGAALAQAPTAPALAPTRAPLPTVAVDTNAMAIATADPNAGDFIYLTRAGDTLIGLAGRLLRDPRRWRELQSRNRIVEPRRIPRGREIRIPYDWLRLTRQSARVVARIGSVTLDGRPLVAGATIDPGASLETAADGSVTLELADGSTVVLQPSSRLRLERMQRIDGAGADEALLQLERGKLETQVKPRGDLGRFEIRTPAAVSAVRGTEFRASYAEAGATATTETLDGAVAVNGGGASVGVRAGFGTRTDRGQPPRAPVPLLPAPKLDGLPPLNDRATLRWQFEPVPGASAYRHQLARDGQFRELLSDEVTTAPASRLDDLPDGRYWLRVRAIDALQIEGYDATAALEQRRRLEPPAPAEPTAGAKRVGAATRFAWATSPDAASYRFQLARDETFVATLEDRAVGRTDPAAAPAASTEVARLEPGRYWWRLAAVDAAGVAGHWGAPQSFEQKAAPVTAEPVPAVREDDARTQTFRWRAAESGQQFEWQLAADPDFRTPLRSGRSTTPEVRLDALPTGRHYLRVRAIDADGFASPFGPARRVDVPPPAWLWFLVPAILLIPAL